MTQPGDSMGSVVLAETLRVGPLADARDAEQRAQQARASDSSYQFLEAPTVWRVPISVEPLPISSAGGTASQKQDGAAPVVGNAPATSNDQNVPTTSKDNTVPATSNDNTAASAVDNAPATSNDNVAAPTESNAPSAAATNNGGSVPSLNPPVSMEEAIHNDHPKPEDRLIHVSNPLSRVRPTRPLIEKPLPCIGSMHRNTNKTPAEMAKARPVFKTAEDRYLHGRDHDGLEGDQASWAVTDPTTATIAAKVKFFPAEADPLVRVEFDLCASWNKGGHFEQRLASFGFHAGNVSEIIRARPIACHADLHGAYRDATAEQLDPEILGNAVEFGIECKPHHLYAHNLASGADMDIHTARLNDLAALLDQGCRVYFLLSSDKAGSAHAFFESLRAQQLASVPYLDNFLLNDRSHNRAQFGRDRFVKAEHRPRFAIGARIQYRDFFEMQTIEGYAFHQEYEHEAEKPVAQEDMHARILGVPAAGGNELILLVERHGSPHDPDPPLELEPGDQVRVRIHALDPDDLEEAKWSGQVMEPIPHAHLHDAPLHVRRPYDAAQATFCGGDPTALAGIVRYERFADPADAVRQIDTAPVHRIAITRTQDEKQYRRRVNTMAHLREMILTERRRSGNDDGGVLEDILLANRFDRLPVVDLFRGVPAGVLQQARASLEGRQLAAFDQLRAQRGGLSLIVGPAGCGKTHLLQLAILTHLQSTDLPRPRALAVSPMNGNVDAIATGLHEATRAATSPMSPRVVLRLQSVDTEWAIFMHVAERRRLASSLPPAPRPRVTGEMLQTALPEDAAWAARAVHVAVQQKLARGIVGDHRVHDGNLSLSLGHQLLLVAGILPSDETVPNLRALALQQQQAWLHQELKAGYDELGSEGPGDADEQESFRKLVRRGMRWVLAHADVVCCTLDRAADTTLAAVFRPTVIAADEQGRALSIDSLVIFTQFPGCLHRLMLGDPLQSRPQTHCPPARNHFALQLGLSLFSRLLLAGFPCTRLNVQHRFVEGITHIVSTMFYDGHLQSVKALDQDPMAARMQGAVTAFLGRAGNIMTVQVPRTVEDHVSVTLSKVNPRSVLACWSLVQQLVDVHGFDAAHIAVLTPYRGQKFMHVRLRSQILGPGADAGPAPQPKFAGVTVETWDKVQGSQHPLVILDVTSAKRLGFVADPLRLNTALSRARFGVIVVVDKQQLALQREYRHRRFSRVLDAIAKQKLTRTMTDEEMDGLEQQWGHLLPSLDERVGPASPPQTDDDAGWDHAAELTGDQGWANEGAGWDHAAANDPGWTDEGAGGFGPRHGATDAVAGCDEGTEAGGDGGKGVTGDDDEGSTAEEDDDNDDDQASAEFDEPDL